MCHWQWQSRMGDVRGGAIVWCRRRRHDQLYRLKSVRGKGKIDDHLWSWLSVVGDRRYCRDAGVPLVGRWSGILHGLRGIKGCMQLVGLCRYEHVLYIILSLCEGVLANQGIEDTPRACMRLVGSGKRSGACCTGRYR